MILEQLQSLIRYAVKERAGVNTNDADQYWAGYIQALLDIQELMK